MKRFAFLLLLLVQQVINQNVTEESIYNLNETTIEENLESTTWSFIDLNTTTTVDLIHVTDIVVSPPVTQILRETFRKYNPFCWRRKHSRGIGRLPNLCPEDAPDRDGLLCYPSCRTGYNGVGPVCWEQCDNMTSMGVACIGIRVSNRSCPWYNICGILRSSCISCPEHYTKLGCLCGRFYVRNTYGRGVGSSLQCSKGDDQSVGLCYNRCKEDFNGKGPICLQNCPLSHPQYCGLACSITKEQCRKQVTEMVVSVSLSALSILNGIIGMPYMASKVTDIISKASEQDWGAVGKMLLKISIVLAEKILPHFIKLYGDWPQKTVESATQNASTIMVATALQDQPILSTFLKFFSLDAVYNAFDHGYCELSNDTLDYIE